MTDIEPLPDPDTPAIRPPRVDLKRWAEEFRDVYRIAEALCKTPFVPKEMIGRQADVAAAIMKGQELGLDPFDALGSIYIVHGRVGFYADFMRRRIVQAGHTLTIIESTETRCIIEGVRKDTGQKHRAQFTADQARRAGIDLGKYPADKLIARATSRLCTQAFPDVLSGTLIAEDLIDGVIPADDGVTDYATAAGPAGPPVQRKRATKPPKAARTQPKPAPTPTEPDTELAELLGDTPPNSGAGGATGADRLSTTHGPVSQHRPPEPAASAATTDTHPDAAISDDVGQPPPTLIDYTTEPDPPITKPQLTKLHTILSKIGIEARDDYLILCQAIIGYHVASTKNLTKNEARQLIDTLENWQQDTEYLIGDRINDILNTAALAADADETTAPPER